MLGRRRDTCAPVRSAINHYWIFHFLFYFFSVGKLLSDAGQTFLGSDEAIKDITNNQNLPPKQNCQDVQEVHVDLGLAIFLTMASISTLITTIDSRIPAIKKQLKELGGIYLSAEESTLSGDLSRYLKNLSGDCLSCSKHSSSERWISSFVLLCQFLGVWSGLHVFLAGYLGGKTFVDNFSLGVVYNSIFAELTGAQRIDLSSNQKAIKIAERSVAWYVGATAVFTYFAFQFKRLSLHALSTGGYLRDQLRTLEAYLKHSSKWTITKDVSKSILWLPLIIPYDLLLIQIGTVKILFTCLRLRPRQALLDLQECLHGEQFLAKFATYMSLALLINTGAKGFFFMKEALCEFEPIGDHSSEDSRLKYAQYSIFAAVSTMALSKVADMYRLIVNTSNEVIWPTLPTTRKGKLWFLLYVINTIVNLLGEGLTSFKGMNSLWHNLFGVKPMRDYTQHQLFYYIPLNLILSVMPGIISGYAYTNRIALEVERVKIEGGEPKLIDEDTHLLECIRARFNDEELHQYEPSLLGSSDSEVRHSDATNRYRMYGATKVHSRIELQSPAAVSAATTQVMMDEVDDPRDLERGRSAGSLDL